MFLHRLNLLPLNFPVDVLSTLMSFDVSRLSGDKVRRKGRDTGGREQLLGLPCPMLHLAGEELLAALNGYSFGLGNPAESKHAEKSQFRLQVAKEIIELLTRSKRTCQRRRRRLR